MTHETTLVAPVRAVTEGISITGLRKSFGAVKALDGVDLTLPPGRIYGLLGPNGAGKTTLMACLCHHIFKTSGTITIDGENPAENAGVLGRTIFVHEDQAYNDAYSIDRILAAMPSFYPTWDQVAAERLIERFRLPIKQRARKLSRGQKSALAAVLSLSARAPYTFLDEPYLGLDPTARVILYEEILRSYSEAPRTIVLSTHLIDEAADLMEEVIVLLGGRVVLQADVDEARDSAFVARGMKEDVRRLAGAREVITEHALGSIVSATIRGHVTPSDERTAAATRVSLERASLQDLVAALGIHELTQAPKNGSQS